MLKIDLNQAAWPDRPFKQLKGSKLQKCTIRIKKEGGLERSKLLRKKMAELKKG